MLHKWQTFIIVKNYSESLLVASTIRIFLINVAFSKKHRYMNIVCKPTHRKVDILILFEELDVHNLVANFIYMNGQNKTAFSEIQYMYYDKLIMLRERFW